MTAATATRILALHCGGDLTDWAILDPFDPRAGTKAYTPYFVYVVEHPDGRILLDTGAHPSLAIDPAVRLGAAAEGFTVKLGPDDAVDAALARIGLTPADVDLVVQSHLHFDHAGGLELLLNCDFTLVARSARIGDGHLNFGQMGGGGVLTLLPRAIGREKAMELLFTGRFLSSEECVAWGLANRVVDDERLLDEGIELAKGIAAKSPLAVANAKEVLHSNWADNVPVDAGLRFELERDVYYCLTSHDAPEGLNAFAEKRTPKFKGR